jgi:hypothetical protein
VVNGNCLVPSIVTSNMATQGSFWWPIQP